jgi:hypothetical protein
MLMAESPEDFRDDVNTLSAEDGTTWVEIASSGTEDEAQLIEGFLRAEEIPAQVENVKFTMEPINFGTMGDIRIYVRAEDEQRAHELLRSREREYQKLDEDGETVVTDEGAAVIEDDTRTEGDDGATS